MHQYLFCCCFAVAARDGDAGRGELAALIAGKIQEGLGGIVNENNCARQLTAYVLSFPLAQRTAMRSLICLFNKQMAVKIGSRNRYEEFLFADSPRVR